MNVYAHIMLQDETIYILSAFTAAVLFKTKTTTHNSFHTSCMFVCIHVVLVLSVLQIEDFYTEKNVAQMILATL